MAANPIMHSKTKHFELDLHFVHDVVQQKLLLMHITARLQLVGILTKLKNHSSASGIN